MNGQGSPKLNTGSCPFEVWELVQNNTLIADSSQHSLYLVKCVENQPILSETSEGTSCWPECNERCARQYPCEPPRKIVLVRHRSRSFGSKHSPPQGRKPQNPTEIRDQETKKNGTNRTMCPLRLHWKIRHPDHDGLAGNRRHDQNEHQTSAKCDVVWCDIVWCAVYCGYCMLCVVVHCVCCVLYVCCVVLICTTNTREMNKNE